MCVCVPTKLAGIENNVLLTSQRRDFLPKRPFRRANQRSGTSKDESSTLCWCTEPQGVRIFPFKCWEMIMTGAGLLKRFGSKERHTWCICAESSPAWTPQLRPGTTIGHKTARRTPSCRVRAYGLPARGNVCRRGRWKGGKVSRTVTALLSVLQKWTWAFPISIKLVTVSGDAPHPGRAFKIKASA